MSIANPFKPPQVHVSENDVLRSLCKSSFYDFFIETWECQSPETLIDNWHIRVVCEEVQKVLELVINRQPKKYDLIINIPPGTTKSSIVSVALQPWLWTRMPEAQVINASYVAPLALDLSRKARDLVEADKFQELFPDIKIRYDQKAKSDWMNNHRGKRYSVGVGGSVTGMHAHCIVVDDPINPKQAASEAELETANTWMRETLPSRKIEKVNTPTILLMQRLHQSDPTGAWIARRDGKGIKHLCLPGTDEYPIKPARMKQYYVDGLLDPKRMTRAVLKELKNDLGQYGYSGQIGQQPTPLEGGMFKTSRIKIETHAPAGLQIVRSWDKAATQDGGDYTAGVKMGYDRETEEYWILDVKHFQEDSGERERIMRQTAEMDGVECVIGIEQEPGASGKDGIRMSVKNLSGFRVRRLLPSGSKVIRADTYSTQVNVGNVHVLKAPWTERYLEELRLFPNGEHDDQVDASSGAFALITKSKKKTKAY